MSEKPGGKYARVVDDEQIAGSEQARKCRKCCIAQLISSALENK